MSADPARGPGRDEHPEHEATRKTVIIAGVANLLVGVVKLAAGILSGSSAMLAEAAHSAADTLNQAFLLRSVSRSERPADTEHPFGYGQERYFWALLAAFGIFIAGAGFSVFEGILALRHGSDASPVPGYLALGVAAVAEGTSLVRASWQARNQARAARVPFLQHLRHSPDTTVKAAFFEDTAAIAGLVLAALGLVLRQVTGSPVFDGAASIAIGGLLVAVAFKLGNDNRALLIGQAADPDQRRLICAEVENTDGIDALLGLQTMRLGPDQLIVAARVSFSDNISADQAEDLADGLDRRLAAALSVTPHVFLDPTQRGDRAPGPECSPDERAASS